MTGTALIEAASRGDKNEVKRLLKEGSADDVSNA
jgi:hypothetical protein